MRTVDPPAKGMTMTLYPVNKDAHDVQFNIGDFDQLCRRGVLLPAGIFNVDRFTYLRGDEPSVDCVAVSARDAYAVLRAWQSYRRAVEDGIRLQRAWVERHDRQLVEDKGDELSTFLARCGGFTVA